MAATIQKTTLMRKENVRHEWLHVDADGQILGRLASQIAMALMGKNRPEYTPHVDTGDYVIVTNAEKITVSGSKADTKEYDSYSYYPGGRKVVGYKTVMAKHPTRIVSEAVRRMLPKNKIGRQMFSKLKVYAGPEHPHAPQGPKELKLN
jgi:large subunit ribosomal protein L13